MNKLFQKGYLPSIFLLIVALSLAGCSGSMESQLKSIAKETNKECPQMLDEYTRLDSCVSFGSTHFKYYLSVLNGIIVSDTTLLKSHLQSQLISTIKTNSKNKFFNENDITLVYQYNGDTGNYLFNIILTPENYRK